MNTTIQSSPPASAKVAAGLNAIADDQQAEEYRRGHADGITWACDYATAAELRCLVENFRPGRDGAFDSPHWRGFVAGAQEVLGAISPLLNDATGDDQESEAYRRGHGDGITWACDYATAAELSDFVADFRLGRGGAFDSPHWRGFVAGAQEVLDAISPLNG
jgi:hypothetical protein